MAAPSSSSVSLPAIRFNASDSSVGSYGSTANSSAHGGAGAGAGAQQQQQQQQQQQYYDAAAALRADTAGSGSLDSGSRGPSTSPMQVPWSAPLLGESMSRRPPIRSANGVAPYLDVMTISSSQFPTAIDGGKNQERHSRLLVEPIAVPALDHTGVPVTVTQPKNQTPYFYKNGQRNKLIRDSIHHKVKKAVNKKGIIPADMGVQDQLATSIRDHVKAKLKTDKKKRNKRMGMSRSAPVLSPATMMRHMRGEGPVPSLLQSMSREGLLAQSSRASTTGGTRRRKGKGKAKGTSKHKGDARRSRTGDLGSTGRLSTPGSVRSVRSTRSAFSRITDTSYASISSRTRNVDQETMELLKSLSATNEAITRAMARS